MTPSLARAIRNIGSMDDVEHIQAALVLLKEKPPQETTVAETTLPQPDTIPVVADKALNLVQKLISDLNDALNEIEWLRDYCDKEIDAFILRTQAELVDYPTCKQAADVYDIEWFSNLPFSDDGLKRVAAMLSDVTEQFLGENGNPVWKDISAGNIATFNRLSELVKGSDALTDSASET